MLPWTRICMRVWRMLAEAGTDMLVMVREQEQQVVATRFDTRELCRLKSVLVFNINKL